MDMIIKSKDKHGNQIEFNPKGRGARYTVNGLKKKGVTTIIGERFGKEEQKLTDPLSGSVCPQYWLHESQSPPGLAVVVHPPIQIVNIAVPERKI